MATQKITLQMFLRAIEIANDGVSANDRKTQKHVRQNIRKNASLMKNHDKNDRHIATAAIRKFVLSLKTFAGVTPPSNDHIATAAKELSK